MAIGRASRRRIVRLGALGAVAAVSQPSALAGAADERSERVGAVEDLMREHGVLRRALIVYDACVPHLLHEPGTIDAAALHRTAQLFHAFGEDYHERKLEEAHIFPRLAQVDAFTGYVDVLREQHARGREITEYVARVTAGAHVESADAAPLAAALTHFVRMYAAHAAREDTVVFPAWKKLLTDHELGEFGERFEQIEHEEFGGDGFDQAIADMTDIERTLGLAELAQFTAPPPPG